MGRFRIIQSLGGIADIIRRIFASGDVIAIVLKLTGLLPLPDYKDSIELRLWLKKGLALLDELADQTETEVDDKMVDALESVINNDAAYNGLHALIMSLIDKSESEIEVLGATDGSELQARAKAVGKEVGIDPFTIISIVMMAIKALAWIRERRGN